jgi:hypothetical protein
MEIYYIAGVFLSAVEQLKEEIEAHVSKSLVNRVSFDKSEWTGLL